jgi:hypothetical protein
VAGVGVAEGLGVGVPDGLGVGVAEDTTATGAAVARGAVGDGSPGVGASSVAAATTPAEAVGLVVGSGVGGELASSGASASHPPPITANSSAAAKIHFNMLEGREPAGEVGAIRPR